jgi:apurinic endonuclease APN1
VHIGFHISIAKGFDWTLKEANRLGCEVIQIFLKNPRSWKRKTWTDSDREAIKKLLGAIPVFAHLTYLPNLAKIDENEQNMTGLIHEVELCVELGFTVMVVHCGSHHDKIKGIKVVAKAINHVTSEYGIDVFIENSAGQGNSIGSNLEELSMIYEGIKEKEKVSLCIDTAHLFAAGYDIRALESWQRIISDIQALFGYKKIGFFHLNDSKAGLASRIDRHWHIGKGEIGSDVFKKILNDVRFKNLMGVMETPKINNMDEENMKVMRALLSPLVPRPSS